MDALHPRGDYFLGDWEDLYAGFDSAEVEGFLGKNALSFLGFDDPKNANAIRLRARYDAYSIAPPSWLATDVP
jgi:hypothetical protein